MGLEATIAIAAAPLSSLCSFQRRLTHAPADTVRLSPVRPYLT